LAALATPVLAQAEADGGATGDIIVTARRTEERLQDVPISITVFDQQQLANHNITNTTDLANYTPSLSVNQRWGPEKASFAIRGFNQDGYTAPTVGIYFADVVGVRAQGGTASGNNVGAGAFMDLQNVQVLKGPQGTLFGRNTTGGAILLVPARPTGDLGGYVEGSIGDYRLRRAMGVLNVPLADTFKVRIGLDRQKRDGYLRNRSGIGPKRFDDIDYFAGRLSILAELTPELENYTIAQFSRSDTAGVANRIVLCDPNAQGFALLTALSGCEQVARQNARGDTLLDVDVNNPHAFQRINQWQVINTTTWRASDALTIKNIVSYGEFRETGSLSVYNENLKVSNPAPDFSAFGLPPYVPGTPYQYVVIEPTPGQNAAAESTLTEELQFQGKLADGRFTYVAGGYLEFSRPLGWNDTLVPIFLDCSDYATFQCNNPLFIGNMLNQRNRLSFDNHGVFAQGTFNLTERLALTVGGRYTFDKIVADNESTQYNFLPGNLGVLNRICQDTFRNANSDGSSPKVVTDPGQCRVRLANTSKKPTWLINLDYKPAPDIMVYAKYARGYRQGGIYTGAIGAETWGPEKVDAYEVGAKTSFRGAVSGYFNIAAFYNDFRNQQVSAGLLPKAGGSGSATIINLGKSEIKGVEVDASVKLFDDLRLDAGYTYLDTRVKAITIPTLPPTSPFSQVTTAILVGDPLPHSPKNKLTATSTYTLPLPDSVGELSVGATFAHTDKQRSTGVLVNPPTVLQVMPATDLLDLNVNWKRVMGSPIDLAFFATNVTNQVYAVDTGGGFNADGFGDLIIGQPRMFGFRIRYNFGT
jgi:iron complex outermembrane receptor protein